MPTPSVVLVVGGSGYLGQFLVSKLAHSEGLELAFTHCSSDPPQFDAPTTAFKVDLAQGSGLTECLSALGPKLAAVINCAAVSQPFKCEQNPVVARATNVPSHLLRALCDHRHRTGCEPLLLHLSTDQVYDGSKPFWVETDACRPINEYGRSKQAAEAEIRKQWLKHIILRSSIIYGPEPPAAPVGRSLFVQFIIDSLASGQKTNFYSDQWRCPVYVKDIVAVCETFIKSQVQASNEHEALGTHHSTPQHGQTFNMGGPQRLSRVDMAKIIASVKGFDPGNIVACSATTSGGSGVASPADISMNSSKLEQAAGIKLQPFQQGICDMLSSAERSNNNNIP